jgi:hypothetical protein
MKWVTSQHAGGGEPHAADCTMLDDGEPRIFRAARYESAASWEQGGRDQLICAQRAHHQAGQNAHERAPGMAESAWRSCTCNASNGVVRAAGRPMITSAARAGAAARADRNASRRRRRARLRWTALRSCRLTANPTRVGSPASRQSTMSAGRSMRLPRWKSA